jgi:hypothetical protein
MKKSTNGPTVKKGTVLGYQPFVVQSPADPEGHLTEEQKTWTLSDELPPEPGAVALPPVVQTGEAQPKLPPAA